MQLGTTSSRLFRFWRWRENYIGSCSKIQIACLSMFTDFNGKGSHKFRSVFTIGALRSWKISFFWFNNGSKHKPSFLRTLSNPRLNIPCRAAFWKAVSTRKALLYQWWLPTFSDCDFKSVVPNFGFLKIMYLFRKSRSVPRSQEKPSLFLNHSWLNARLYQIQCKNETSKWLKELERSTWDNFRNRKQ